MLMIICPENRQEEVRALIAQHDIHSYSEIPNVLAASKKDELVQALKEYNESLFEGEGLRVFALPVESLF